MKHQNKRILLSIVFTLFSLFTITAQKATTTVLTKATEVFYEISDEIRLPETYLIVNKKEVNLYIINFENDGWIILKGDSSESEVLAFSEKGNFNIDNNKWYSSDKDASIVSKVIKDTIISKAIFNTSDNKNTEDYIAPFLTDTWGGVNCFYEDGSNVYPTNYYTPTHCSPGCVAISTAQILHYYEWPIKGVGSNTYFDEYNDTPLRHSAFYDNTTYDWNNMLDEYMYVNSTDIEQQAVGQLMYDVGISVEMDYELTGSTNNLDNVPFALENFFRFGGDYHTSGWGSFWSKLYESMQQHRPVPIAIENSENSEGHVMVANGYKFLSGSNYYHINWGWYDLDPTNNGWYNIQGWEVGDTGYDTVLGAIFDMLPEPQITSVIPTGSGDDFKVNWTVSDRLNWEEFTLEQKVDSGSWEEVASGITTTNYTISSPTGTVYQFRVKAKVDGEYYNNSWSEVKVYAVSNWYNGYGSFEGSQYAYAKQTPNNDLNFTSNYTFETWIRLHPGNQNGDVILDQKDVYGFTINDVTGSDYSVTFNANPGGTLNSSAGGGKLMNDQWYHIAVSKSGSTAKLFVNGELRDSGSSGFNLPSSNNYLNLGEKYHGSYSSWILADFDQVRLSTTGRYSSAFTPSQDEHFVVDDQTTAYLTFQDVHRARLKDLAYKLSFVVKNQAGYVNWDFDENSGSLTTEEQELFNNCINVYPNPTTNSISIAISENDLFELNQLNFYIYNEMGQLVMEPYITKDKAMINLSQLENGVYYLQIKGNRINATQKIIKQ